MKPPPFRYERPGTVEAALAVLADHGDDARLLAGGQSLVPMLNMRLSSPGVLVDINHVEGLDFVDADDGELVVGAMTRQRALERSPLARRCPLLEQCLPYVGHAATRNRGTVGGSIAHADPAAELPLALLATGGSVEVAGPEGRRRVDARQLFSGFLTTSLRPGEMVVECRFGLPAGGERSGFAEAALRHGDFAYVTAAAVVDMSGGQVTAARVAVGAVADRPLLLEEAAARLAGTDCGPAARAAAADAARQEVDPSGSLHAPADYQRHLVGVMVSRALAAAVDGAPEGVG